MTQIQEPVVIQQINDIEGWTPEDAQAAGWDGPGWYFWDESWAYCHGPFSTREEASKALSIYCRDILGM